MIVNDDPSPSFFNQDYSVRTANQIVWLIPTGLSCSQNLSTPHPRDSKAAEFRRSRSILASNFFRHHSTLFFGWVACTGQPCQKQPSIKTTTRGRVNTMSPLHRSDASGRKSTRYRSPAACRRRRTCNSTLVSRRRCVCIRRRTESSRGSGTIRAQTWS